MTLEATHIGARIMEAREAKEMTIAQAATRLGVKTTTLQNWESGTTAPRANRLQMLAGVLDTSMLWLLSGSAEHEPTHLTASKIEIVAQKLERANSLQLELNGLLAEVAMEVAEIQHLEAELDHLAA